MKNICVALLMGCVAASSFADGDPLVLKPSKDNFARSNKRNRNNGKSETLVIAHAANVRAMIAFDLSAVTNKIISAELRFRQHNAVKEQVSLIIAPMVNTEHNAAWEEGSGNLGTSGQNARPGESCYIFSAFPDTRWESASGDELTSLSDSGLWLAPVAALNGQAWQEDRWIRVPINDISLLEKIIKSETPTITFGLWGKAGNGLYFISSSNSQWPPELHLHQQEE
jgi:hypothetical protein